MSSPTVPIVPDSAFGDADMSDTSSARAPSVDPYADDEFDRLISLVVEDKAKSPPLTPTPTTFPAEKKQKLVQITEEELLALRAAAAAGNPRDYPALPDANEPASKEPHPHSLYSKKAAQAPNDDKGKGKVEGKTHSFQPHPKITPILYSPCYPIS